MSRSGAASTAGGAGVICLEAEGPAELVKSQFEDFKEIIANSPRQTPASTVRPPKPGDIPVSGELQLDKICRVDGRVVLLTVKAEAESTAAMLIMLAQRTYRANETVTASEIKDGLEQSGYRPGRIDRIMQPRPDWYRETPSCPLNGVVPGLSATRK